MKKILQMKLYIALHNNINASISLVKIQPLLTILCALNGTLLTFWMSSNLGCLMSGVTPYGVEWPCPIRIGITSLEIIFTSPL